MNYIELPSPNYDERPDNIKIDTIVLHATVFSTIEEIDQAFKDPEKKTSAHYTIDKQGITYCHVPDKFRAWHAGLSRMPDGREKANDFSIGIELVNLNDGVDQYTSLQYESVIDLIKKIIFQHSIKFIVSHKFICFPPGRKSDPLGLDFKFIEEKIKNRSIKEDIVFLY